MKEIVIFDCPEGKSVIEETALQLFKRMVTHNQSKAKVELELKDPSATICMTIEIKLK